jgi:hypothetical protein
MTPPLINIVAAQQVGDYCIHIEFDDHTVQDVDFKPFLSRALHPVIRSWLAPEKFAAFRVEYGELVWGDYELCFPLIDLYHNQINYQHLFETAA